MMAIAMAAPAVAQKKKAAASNTTTVATDVKYVNAYEALKLTPKQLAEVAIIENDIAFRTQRFNQNAPDKAAEYAAKMQEYRLKSLKNILTSEQVEKLDMLAKQEGVSFNSSTVASINIHKLSELSFQNVNSLLNLTDAQRNSLKSSFGGLVHDNKLTDAAKAKKRVDILKDVLTEDQFSELVRKL